MVPGSESVFTAAAAAGGIYMPLMMFECEGLVPQQYAFNGGWKLTTVSSSSFIIIASQISSSDCPAFNKFIVGYRGGYHGELSERLLCG